MDWDVLFIVCACARVCVCFLSQHDRAGARDLVSWVHSVVAAVVSSTQALDVVLCSSSRSSIAKSTTSGAVSVCVRVCVCVCVSALFECVCTDGIIPLNYTFCYIRTVCIMWCAFLCYTSHMFNSSGRRRRRRCAACRLRQTQSWRTGCCCCCCYDVEQFGICACAATRTRN